jgi:L-gulono-1,4-lactone dehydrogenase
MGNGVERLRTFVNFGRNVRWQARRYHPRNDDDVLEILARHGAERIRAIGSLHSWSDIAMGTGVTLDMSEFADVRPYGDKVQVGAGCTLDKLLQRLHSLTQRTLPTLGAIKRQTIAGMISTGTHGSGKPSLSHFVTAVRFAAYDAAGKPQIFEYRDGRDEEKLKAARCALGCMGILLQIELATVPKYRVRETVRRIDGVEGALRLYALHPLTQFALVPHAWKVIAWERHRMPPGESGGCPIRAALFRVVNLVIVDYFFHYLLKVCLLAGPAWARGLIKSMPALMRLTTNVPRVDQAEHVLTLRHELFRHEEMEMFVRESRVVEASAVLRCALEIFAGDPISMPVATERSLREAALYDELTSLRGSYVHHYPVVFRRVQPEDTLISMAAASGEDWFSLSLFTYYPPRKRQAFYDVCSWCARAMHALFGARLHWGKHYPRSFDAQATASVHPGMRAFKEICRTVDPRGVFRNEFTDRMLGPE